ncbi:hypothetical protein Gpo141_00013486, partial [Globisporangium polare]
GDLTLSQSCRVKPGVNKLPQQVHLAYAGATAGTGMAVSWATFANVADSAVWIGTSATNLELSTSTVSIASYYSEGDYSLFQNHATLSGLTPNTKYYYKVGSASDTTLQSDVASFTTARSASDATTFDVLVYGDAGDGDNSAATIEYVNTLGSQVDFVYHIGDISYADDDYLVASQALGFFYEEVYNKWMNSMTPIMSQVAYMVSVGNHEAECHSPNCQLSSYKKDHLGNYTAYNSRFAMPSKESGGVLNMWHSFEHGPLHITTISSETDYPGAPTNQYTLSNKNGNFGNQLAWVEADLKKAAANRADVPWIIVAMHRPMYSIKDADASGNPTGQPKIIQAAFEELFIKYGVDVVVAGHEHSYERNFPIARGAAVTTGVSSDNSTYVNPKAPVYMITGAAGTVENHTTKPTNTVPWNAASDNSNWGVSVMTVSRSSLEFKFVASANQAVLDRFVITKN